MVSPPILVTTAGAGGTHASAETSSSPDTGYETELDHSGRF